MAGHDIGIIALGALAAIFAGISKGGFGSGAAFASASILALVLPPAQALGIMLPLLMLIDAATLRPYWRRWSWPETRAAALGRCSLARPWARALHHRRCGPVPAADRGDFIGIRRMAVQHARGTDTAAQSPLPGWAGLLAGIVAGFTSFVSHAGGPVAAVYLLSRRLDKTAFQATTVLLFALLNVVKFVPYAYLGIFHGRDIGARSDPGPFRAAGGMAGRQGALARARTRMFFAITYVALTLTGIKLIWDALS